MSVQNGAEWWRGCVIYQVYPRSFMDANGDGCGDLAGVTAKLDHIASLGVDAVWLSPFFASPMKDMGYDVADYCDVDPSFGTLADFDAMVARAHALGLKVVIDQVYSHSSDRHPAFLESRESRDNPRADWYVWADAKPDGSAPNNWMARFGGIAWEWEPRRGQYYLHNFLKEQPDLNFHNPEVRDFVCDVMRFWLDRGVDGFRLDVVNFYYHDRQLRDEPVDPEQEVPLRLPVQAQLGVYSRNRPENLDFLKRMRAVTDAYGDRMMVGEIGGRNEANQLMADYTSQGRLHMAYSFGLLGADFSPAFFRNHLERFFRAAPDGWPCWSFSNHDVIRHVTRWRQHGASRDAFAKQMAALLLSLEGSVCLYQGEELGLPETDLAYEDLVDPKGINFWPADKGRDGCRTPIPWTAGAAHAGFSTADRAWLPVKPDMHALAVDRQSDEVSVLSFYKTMLAFRRDTAGFRLGRTAFVDTPAPFLAFHRGEDHLCCFNLSPGVADLDLLEEVTPVVAQGVVRRGAYWSFAANGFLIGRRQTGGTAKARP